MTKVRRHLHGDAPIDDGFGSCWERCPDPLCDLEIVRPGKVQCSDYCITPSTDRERCMALGRFMDREWIKDLELAVPEGHEVWHSYRIVPRVAGINEQGTNQL